jgi:hypothetical protein
MQEAGWIERRPDPTDRRARRLFLTDKARPVLGRIWDVSSETQDQVLASLSPDEAEQLIDLLRRVHGSMTDRAPSRPLAATIRPLMPKSSVTTAPVPEGTR